MNNCVYRKLGIRGNIWIWASAWDFQQFGMCDQQGLRSACAYAQSDQSLCLSLEYSMTVKLQSKHHLEIISLKGGCTGSSESTLVKIPHCWKSHVAAHLSMAINHYQQRTQFLWSLHIVNYHYVTTVLQTNKNNQCMRFPTIWHFDMCRLRQASAVTF